MFLANQKANAFKLNLEARHFFLDNSEAETEECCMKVVKSVLKCGATL